MGCVYLLPARVPGRARGSAALPFCTASEFIPRPFLHALSAPPSRPFRFSLPHSCACVAMSCKQHLPEAPGEGPSKEDRDTGFFWIDYRASGKTQDGKEVVCRGKVGSDKGDCGYKETGKVCLCDCQTDRICTRSEVNAFGVKSSRPSGLRGLCICWHHVHVCYVCTRGERRVLPHSRTRTQHVFLLAVLLSHSSVSSHCSPYVRLSQRMRSLLHDISLLPPLKCFRHHPLHSMAINN